MFELAIVAILLAIFLGVVLGWVAFFRVRTLEQEVAKLKAHFNLADSPQAQVTAQQPFEDAEDITLASAAIDSDSFPELPDLPDDLPDQLASGSPTMEIPYSPAAPPPTPAFFSQWRNQWMIWLGGLCVALAGIFMVRYSIEMGLLGPKARIALALATGIGFHVVAERLRRQRGAHPVFAALAGGASITLYAALLAALHLYQLLDANLVFVLLAIVSLATMVLALRHGPELAAIGLLGGYVVPVLVSTGSNNIVAAMVYALIIAAAGLLLLRFIFRPWLWWGVVAGILAWWLVSLTSSASDFRGLYLAIAAYLLLALPTGNWLLAARENAPSSEAAAPPLLTSLVLVILAWAFSLGESGVAGLYWWRWAPLVLVIGLAARNLPPLRALPWVALLAMVTGIVASQLEYYLGRPIALVPAEAAAAKGLLAFALQMAALQVALGLITLMTRPFSHALASFTALTPLVWLALAYLLTGDLSGSWQWSLATLAFGAGYLGLSGRRLLKTPNDPQVIWLLLGGHVAYSLAVAMYFREAGLTLALAAQLITLTWLLRRFHLPWLPWLVKAVLAIVVARLSLNPWLASYPSDIHWSLWSYGGSTLCCFIATRLLAQNQPLRPWLEAATLHLLVLTLGAEVRYWLYDGAIFSHRYSLQEAAINTALWTGLGLSYCYRARFSESLTWLYCRAADILLTLALASYLIAATVLNPLWSGELVSPQPVWNLLLLAYGAPVVLALVARRFYRPDRKALASLLAALGLLLFVSLEIRHLWQGALSLHLTTGNGELYTYSIVWLLLAVAAIVVGTLWRNHQLDRGGFILLAVVIGKIFLVDMDDLEGLLRVASFMGLGLSLLGLAYLRSRLATIRPSGNETTT